MLKLALPAFGRHIQDIVTKALEDRRTEIKQYINKLVEETATMTATELGLVKDGTHSRVLLAQAAVRNLELALAALPGSYLLIKHVMWEARERYSVEYKKCWDSWDRVGMRMLKLKCTLIDKMYKGVKWTDVRDLVVTDYHKTDTSWEITQWFERHDCAIITRQRAGAAIGY